MIETGASRAEGLFGTLQGVTNFTRYRSGALRSCMVNRENRIETGFGTLVPQYRSSDYGERQKKHRSAIDFHENGQIKSIALDRQTELPTPMGMIPAELVTFYPDGALNRIFPLNGKVDGFWSEADERGMAVPIEFDLSIGAFAVKAISVRFFPSGNLKSVTFWPGESAIIQTPVGPIQCRAGFSLHEDGSLSSLEPKVATPVPTPVGLIQAFDPEIIGMHADTNSLQFDTGGRLTALKTIHTGIRLLDTDGNQAEIQPSEAPSLIDPEQLRTIPMSLQFKAEEVWIEAESPAVFSLADKRFETFARTRTFRETCSDCPGDDTCCENNGSRSGCSGCQH
ncbi:MAG: hypothetical protein ACLFU4_00775 [Opitutales bacterium]